MGKKMATTRSYAVWLVIFVQVLPVFASLPPVGTANRVALIRVEGRNGRKDLLNVEKLQSHLKQWMENLPDRDFMALSADQSVSLRLWEQEILRAEVVQLDRGLRALLVQQSPTENFETSLVDELSQKLSQVETPSRWGKIFQETYMTEAMVHWKSKRNQLASQALRNAALSHPLGLLPIAKNLPSHFSENFDWAGFQGEMSRVSQFLRRDCQLSVELPIRAKDVAIDGFLMGNSTQWSVTSGRLHSVSFLDEKGREFRGEFQCDRPGKLKFQEKNFVNTSSVKQVRSVADVLRKTGTDRALVLVPNANEVELFTYREGRPEKLSMTKKISLADIELNRWKEEIGITPQDLSLLMDKYEDRKTASLSNSVFPGASPGLTQAQLKEDAWYQDWRVWAVAGGVLGGITVGYLLSRHHQVSGQTAGLNIRMR